MVGWTRGDVNVLERNKGFLGVVFFHPSDRETYTVLSCVNSRLSECAFDPGSSGASPASAATVRRRDKKC